MNQIYCVKCRRFTETRDIKQITTKNNCQMLQGICVACGTKKSKFIKSQKGKVFLNNTINSLPFEMLIPGHNFKDLAQSWTNVWMRIWLQRHGQNQSTELTRQLITMTFVMLKTKTQKLATKFVIKICWQSLMVFITPHFEKGRREVLFLRLSGQKSASDGG